MTITTKRVYDPPAPGDGFRVLVDRLWPRGLRKDHAHLDLWAKEAAPSTELRQWFHTHTDAYDEFATRYRHELATNPAAATLRDQVADKPTVTLLHSVRDADHNHARILADFLDPAGERTPDQRA